MWLILLIIGIIVVVVIFSSKKNNSSEENNSPSQSSGKRKQIYKCCKCGAEYDLTGIHVITLDPCPHCGGKLFPENYLK